jgi:hypothetical protein
MVILPWSRPGDVGDIGDVGPLDCGEHGVDSTGGAHVENSITPLDFAEHPFTLGCDIGVIGITSGGTTMVTPRGSKVCSLAPASSASAYARSLPDSDLFDVIRGQCRLEVAIFRLDGGH